MLRIIYTWLIILVLSVAVAGVNASTPAEQDGLVHFGQPQPQPTTTPGTPAAAGTHFLLPDDIAIKKGGTVNFVVNGGGHGIAIHAVSNKTTRQDIAQDLCDGATPEDPDPIVDRTIRAAICNGAVPTSATIDGTLVNFTGTQNLAYTITDGKGKVIIDTGFNITLPTTPPTVLVNNPRVDDAVSSERLLATSGRSHVNDTTVPAANPAGAFVAGSTPTAPGNRIQVRFDKIGRYLVVCMNRGHFLNDHMFGFVDVVDSGAP